MKKELKITTVKTKIIALYIIAFSIAAVFLVYIGITLMSVYGDSPMLPNVIGDTLGGTLSPLIGLVSAILIYITIGQQIEANRLIQEQFEVERKEKLEEVIFKEVMAEMSDRQKFAENLSLKFRRRDSALNPIYCSKMLDHSLTLIEPRNNGVVLEGNHQELLTRIPNNLAELIETVEFFCDNVHKNRAYAKIIEWNIRRFELLFPESFYVGGELPTSDFPITEIFEENHSKNLDLVIRYYKAKSKINEMLPEPKFGIKSLSFWENLKEDVSDYGKLIDQKVELENKGDVSLKEDIDGIIGQIKSFQEKVEGDDYKGGIYKDYSFKFIGINTTFS